MNAHPTKPNNIVAAASLAASFSPLSKGVSDGKRPRVRHPGDSNPLAGYLATACAYVGSPAYATA